MAQIGSRNHRAKLTEHQVREIRRMQDNRKRTTQSALAKRYGVSKAVIGKIVTRSAWKHVR